MDVLVIKKKTCQQNSTVNHKQGVSFLERANAITGVFFEQRFTIGHLFLEGVELRVRSARKRNVILIILVSHQSRLLASDRRCNDDVFVLCINLSFGYF